MKELAEKARSKKLMPNEYQGGSFFNFKPGHVWDR